MPRKFFLLAVLLSTISSTAIHAQTMPQTARQALIEMFSGKTPGGLEKHLPEVTLAAIRKAPPGSTASMIEGFSMLSGQMQSHNHIQTFEAGPTLVISEDPQTNSKFEVLVARDDLRGETDDIELSFRAYKDGQSQTGGINPRLLVAMQQEQGIWRLHNLTISIGISLTDPALLKGITTPIKPTFTTTNTATTTTLGAAIAPTMPTAAMKTANESSATASIRTINTAQVTYATSYPTHGFACSLSDLGGIGGGSNPDEHHAMLLEPRLSNGKKNGYVFKVANCSGSPASSFSVTAAPTDPGSGSRAFCSDQSGVVRFSSDGNPATCLSAGQPVQ